MGVCGSEAALCAATLGVHSLDHGDTSVCYNDLDHVLHPSITCATLERGTRNHLLKDGLHHMKRPFDLPELFLHSSAQMLGVDLGQIVAIGKPGKSGVALASSFLKSSSVGF